MRSVRALSLLAFIFILSGCSTTFGGTVLLLSFGDILLYVVLAFIVALLIYLKASVKKKQAFWLWFILSLVLTPLAGFIYLLILFSRRNKID
jgi:hypothetical protein